MTFEVSKAKDSRVPDQAANPTQGEASAATETASLEPIQGGNLRVVDNMEASLGIPTASSYRTVPVKLLEENRRIINEHLQAAARGKISFTHLISWAIVQALRNSPEINTALTLIDGSPHTVRNHSVNLGIAVDHVRKDGSRTLLVPNIKHADSMRFTDFWRAYDSTIDRTRTGLFAPADFQDTTVSLTNPGTVGTLYSVPRLMKGQGAVIATGAIEYPAEFHAWSPQAISSLGLSKVMTISCTYDHRIIHGAQSGEFLGRVKELLLGGDSFYERIFEDLRIPAVPIRLTHDHHPPKPVVSPSYEDLDKQMGVLRLINLYRVRGHLIATLDPLADNPLYHPELDPANFGLTMWDLDRVFATGGLGGMERGTLRQILALLREAYCKSVGVEYRHIQDPDEKTWIKDRIEPERSRESLDPDTQLGILHHLIAAEGFEKYLHTKFVGHKRFGLEGAETVIPVLARMLSEAANFQTQEAVIGMAHRGRLNVFANILGVPLAKILAEFEEIGDPLATHGSGDVRYHLGASGPFRSAEGNSILVSLAPNPSHLEWVNPVVEGIVRAKQERRGDAARDQVLPILVHGDAAFAGQGVVWETINLSQLYGYRTGGTIHLIINNQIGFTTTPEESRSSPYATDLARSVQAPIFHVNGDDPEASVRMASLAVLYRRQFKKDVVLDIFCYRRHGHNEADEPGYTQPLLYKKIASRPSVTALYAKKLEAAGVVTKELVDHLQLQFRKRMDEAFEQSQRGDQKFLPDVPLAVTAEELSEFQPSGETGVPLEILRRIASSLSHVPDGFKLHPKLHSFMAKRAELAGANPAIDWSFAEALAFGTLVYDGNPVRLSGQDSARGTFSQRHAILTDLETGKAYLPLQNVSDDQAPFGVFDSSLSEAAVLGFEFGYSAADPLALVLWEAQFGDFANGAQVIIDNFIASSEVKWQQRSDLVLLLPHGFEGQGPEHSSARLERFLSLCAEENMRVCSPTTPSQYFHLLRRQMRDAKQIPLVVMTPKSLLRHPKAVSSAQDLAGGKFELVLEDPDVHEPQSVSRLLFCCGKVYYELLEERLRRKDTTTSIIRIEQLYPFPDWNISKIFSNHSRVRRILWVQEEPQNMGAWNFIRVQMSRVLPVAREIRYVGRPDRASPAAGSYKKYRQEQTALIEAAFE
jgi:2-oxoglutarate dehydrogenase E1 component